MVIPSLGHTWILILSYELLLFIVILLYGCIIIIMSLLLLYINIYPISKGNGLLDDSPQKKQGFCFQKLHPWHDGVMGGQIGGR